MKKERLLLTRSAARSLRKMVRRAGRSECMGLLASAPRVEPITYIQAIEADASTTHATAAPESIKRAIDSIRARNLIPRGICHSHGHFSCFHSAVDRQMLEQNLPAMAEANFDRSRPAFLAPAVTDRDTACLPRPVGRAMVFDLLGDPIPGLDARERSSWSSVDVAFKDESHGPCAVFKDKYLYLVGETLVLRLEMPAGSSLSCTLRDVSSSKTACVYSLVTNLAGEYFAEALVFTETENSSWRDIRDCDVRVIDGAPARDVSDGGSCPVGASNGRGIVGFIQRALHLPL